MNDVVVGKDQDANRRARYQDQSLTNVNNSTIDLTELYWYSRVAVTISLKLETNHG
jgi:hypothetical protein